MNETDGLVAILDVCAELNVGTLQGDVTVTLFSTDGSATSTGIRHVVSVSSAIYTGQ